MSLSEWMVHTILSESVIKNVIVIYPGRYQPMGRHHAAVYKKLASQFGQSNTYIATSDVVNSPKSPLNFREKSQVMKAHGITNVVQVKNPYQSLEIVNKYNPETTAVLFAVGKKDMAEDPRFQVGAKKNGEPSYFQYYDEHKNNLQPYGNHGYLIVAPHVDIQIPGFGEMSGTTLRQILASADETTFKNVMGFYDPKIHMLLKNKFQSLKTETVTRIGSVNKLVAFSKNWWSKLIVEGRYDSLVTTLSRDIVNQMKNRKGTHNYEVSFDIERGDVTAEIDLIVKFKPRLNWEYAYETKGWTDGQTMEITLTFNPSTFPASYSNLIPELKETLRHEIEHVAQEHFQDTKTIEPKSKAFYQYLLAPYEIAAFTQGLYKRAKTKRIPIDIAMEEWFNENIRNFSPSQKYNHWNIVKSAWLKYAHKHIPTAQYSDKASKGNGLTNEMQSLLVNESKANTHLTHLEELILTQGPDGYKLARSFLLELIKNLKGNSNNKVNTTVKWDGAPAIISGIDPISNRFFVGTKSVFNKDPKLNFTNKDIDRNHSGAPGLVDKLKKALAYLPKLGYKNIMQGDFMFDSSTLKTQTIDGVKHYTFKPNTITYAVETDSDLGQQISNAKFGIVFHTGYKNLQSGAEFGVSVSNIKQTPDVWFDDAYFKDATGVVLLTEAETAQVINLIKEADNINIDYRSIPSDLINIYINSEIRIGQFINSPAKSYEALLKWTQLRNDKMLDKLKSASGKEKALSASKNELKSITDNKQNIINAFKVTKLLANAKMIFVQKYNNAVYRTKHFVDNGTGELRTSNPEGYVAIDHIGNAIKLVDRLEFSKANFAMDKGFTK